MGGCIKIFMEANQNHLTWIQAVIIVQGPVFVGVLFSWIFRKSQDFDRNVTFTSVLAVTRKWNVAGVYLHFLYNMWSKQVNLLIIVSQLWIFNKFYYYQILSMFNHPEIKFLQSEFRCLHLSAHVHIFSHCMTSYNIEANVIFVIFLALMNSLIHTHEKWTLPVP
jgi:hypothetical protein